MSKGRDEGSTFLLFWSFFFASHNKGFLHTQKKHRKPSRRRLLRVRGGGIRGNFWMGISVEMCSKIEPSLPAHDSWISTLPLLDASRVFFGAQNPPERQKRSTEHERTDHREGGPYARTTKVGECERRERVDYHTGARAGSCLAASTHTRTEGERARRGEGGKPETPTRKHKDTDNTPTFQYGCRGGAS